ncbi:hypothetical protein GQR58_001815 [Nymphon striatum]|nr:hypothetical protein GQR58_001815 [Nymphon striatum]
MTESSESPENQNMEEGSENEEQKAMLETFQVSPKRKTKVKKPLFFRSASSASFFKGLRRLGSTSSNCSSDEDLEVSKPPRPPSIIGRTCSETKSRRKRLVKQSTFCEGELPKKKDGVICSSKELTSILSLSTQKTEKQRVVRDGLEGVKNKGLVVSDEAGKDVQSSSGERNSISVGPTLEEDLNEEEEEEGEDIFVSKISNVEWDESRGSVDAQELGGAIENFLQGLSVG